MHKVVITLFALSFAHMASAQEPAGASPQFTGKVVKGKVAANATPKELEFAVERMKEQMLAAQEAQLPFRAKTLELLILLSHVEKGFMRAPFSTHSRLPSRLMPDACGGFRAAGV